LSLPTAPKNTGTVKTLARIAGKTVMLVGALFPACTLDKARRFLSRLGFDHLIEQPKLSRYCVQINE
jgi:hypothetical protein